MDDTGTVGIKLTVQPTEEISTLTELPIVVPDWDRQLKLATRMAQLIDRHLEHERRGSPDRTNLMPNSLCKRQRVDLVTDLTAVT